MTSQMLIKSNIDIAICISNINFCKTSENKMEAVNIKRKRLSFWIISFSDPPRTNIEPFNRRFN
jgi:hypothetical protein